LVYFELEDQSGGVMTARRGSELVHLEGSQVSVALRDGHHIDDRHLVSAGQSHISSLWLFADGADTFVALDDVIDIWEAAS